jgi:hypothetical protein
LDSKVVFILVYAAHGHCYNTAAIQAFINATGVGHNYTVANGGFFVIMASEPRFIDVDATDAALFNCQLAFSRYCMLVR